MIVREIDIRNSPGSSELTAVIRRERDLNEYRLYFKIPQTYAGYLNLSGDPFLAALLLPSMALGERLVIERAPVSLKLLQSVDTIQDIYCQWFSRVKRIDVDAPIKLPADDQTRSMIGCFFTAGVDSFYSLLKNATNCSKDQEQISHLIFVNGFERIHKNREMLAHIRKKNSVCR